MIVTAYAKDDDSEKSENLVFLSEDGKSLAWRPLNSFISRPSLSPIERTTQDLDRQTLKEVPGGPEPNLATNQAPLTAS